MMKNAHGIMPKLGQKYLIHLEERLKDGQLLNSTYKENKPMEIRLGAQEVHEDIELALCRMKLNDIKEISIKLNEDQKEIGNKPESDGEPEIIYKVELLKII